jgi:nicotinate-nucleotide adenylyltransferase
VADRVQWQGARRVGVLGGSFDPIHLGHLIAAECVRDALALDVVLFVPAQRSPLKDADHADVPHRLEMVRLALAGHPGFALSTVDLDRPPPSYTADTLLLLHQACPEASLHFILGADAFAELHRWRDPEAITRLAELVVVDRPIMPATADPQRDVLAEHGEPAVRSLDDARVRYVDIPTIGISSTAIRHRVRTGQSVRFQVPDAVARYIATHALYRADAPPAREPAVAAG